jgi:membrane associated rhomboid family serine protease
VIPLRDENPTMHTSVVTFTLIAANVAVWVLVQGLGFDPALTRSVWKFGLVPGELLGKIPAGSELIIGRGLKVVFDGQANWLSPLTSMFMHGGWFHLIGNMWFLAVFGDNVEDVLGPVKFLLFYIVCGLAAATAQVLANPASPIPMVGASGAIGGIMGAYAVLFPRAPVQILVIFGFWIDRVKVPAFFMLGYWFVLQLISGIPALGNSSGGGVAFWAHIGGFVTGVVIVKFLCGTNRLEYCRQQRGRTERMFERYYRS